MYKNLDGARIPACLLALALAMAISALAVGAVPERAQAQQSSGGGSGGLEIDARGWALADEDSGRVLAGENPDEQIKMASTAKVMTALVVLESDVNMDEEVVISAGA
nr:hypothetical protein [Actinomycetota bacterium]